MHPSMDAPKEAACPSMDATQDAVAAAVAAVAVAEAMLLLLLLLLLLHFAVLALFGFRVSVSSLLP